jgi:hypothetical protein
MATIGLPQSFYEALFGGATGTNDPARAGIGGPDMNGQNIPLGPIGAPFTYQPPFTPAPGEDQNGQNIPLGALGAPFTYQPAFTPAPSPQPDLMQGTAPDLALRTAVARGPSMSLPDDLAPYLPLVGPNAGTTPFTRGEVPKPPPAPPPALQQLMPPSGGSTNNLPPAPPAPPPPEPDPMQAMIRQAMLRAMKPEDWTDVLLRTGLGIMGAAQPGVPGMAAIGQGALQGLNSAQDAKTAAMKQFLAAAQIGDVGSQAGLRQAQVADMARTANLPPLISPGRLGGMGPASTAPAALPQLTMQSALPLVKAASYQAETASGTSDPSKWNHVEGPDPVNDEVVGPRQIKVGTGAQFGFTRDQLITDEGASQAADAILGHYLEKYKSPAAALVAYHGGEGTADKWVASNYDPNVLGPKTQQYLKDTYGTFRQLRASQGQGGGSPVQQVADTGGIGAPQVGGGQMVDIPNLIMRADVLSRSTAPNAKPQLDLAMQLLKQFGEGTTYVDAQGNTRVRPGALEAAKAQKAAEAAGTASKTVHGFRGGETIFEGTTPIGSTPVPVTTEDPARQAKAHPSAMAQ